MKSLGAGLGNNAENSKRAEKNKLNNTNYYIITQEKTEVISTTETGRNQEQFLILARHPL